MALLHEQLEEFQPFELANAIADNFHSLVSDLRLAEEN